MTPARASIRVWAGFALMCVALFMSVLDVQIVLTALPTMQRALRIDADAMSWIQTSYLTAEVISIPLSGLLVRALSLRWCMVIAVAGFQLDGVFIGATRARELRDSMFISFAGYWLLAVFLAPRFGNNGLWCAFLCFMILRGGNLALRLPRIEKSFDLPVPVSST